MKLLASVFVLSTSCAAAEEHTWHVQHLAYSGGTRALLVSEADAQFSEAFIRNDETMTIAIGCQFSDKLLPPGSLDTYIRIGNGGPFVDPYFKIAGHELEIEGHFDEEQTVMLGQFSYARGSYWALLPPQKLLWFASSTRVTLRGAEGALEVSYSLDGAVDALKQVSCENM